MVTLPNGCQLAVEEVAQCLWILLAVPRSWSRGSRTHPQHDSDGWRRHRRAGSRYRDSWLDGREWAGRNWRHRRCGERRRRRRHRCERRLSKHWDAAGGRSG